MIEQITPQHVMAKLSAGEPIYFLDVRQPEEHQHCKIPGDTLVPLGDLPFSLGEIQPPEGCLVVVYCHHGVRSLRGAMILKQAGFENVASLAGGIDAWSLQVDPSIKRY